MENFKNVKSKYQSNYYIRENLYRNHAGLFFSLNTLKKINILKFVAKGKFGKVTYLNYQPKSYF